MRRVLSGLVAVGAASAFSVTAAGAQIPDVPPLGFEISPTQGAVGSQVDGQVNVDDVAEHCITDPDEFVGQFVDLENPDTELTPYLTAVQAYGEQQGFLELGPEEVANNPQAFAWAVSLLFPLGLAQDLPSQGGTGDLVAASQAQTFVMAFADIATASPIEPRGTFDAATGEGQVAVPDIAAGAHPVIATCVALRADLTVDDIGTAVDAGAAFVEANLTAPYPIEDVTGPEFAAAAAQVAPVIIEQLIEPVALGVQFFTVTAGGPGGPTTPPPAPPATPVPGRPSFTG
jgi:hypothetical protein